MGLLEEYRVAVASAIGGWTPTILTHFYKIVVSPTPCTPEREKHYNQFNIKILPSLTSLKEPLYLSLRPIQKIFPILLGQLF